MQIKVLPSEIANMIAAGEVVERPFSVVKELVENSIDAKSKNITIEIKKGAMSFIRVTDDGVSMHPDDVKTAFLRHATSKIKTKEDLEKIYTLGFRGEALASICAVSKVDIFTKRKDDSFGQMACFEAGHLLKKEVSSTPDGTTIIVRDLFFNTPARMKFLKSDQAENAQITDLVGKFILANPTISFKLIINSKQTIFYKGKNLQDAILCVYGKDFIKNLIEVNYKTDIIEVTGFIGNASLCQKTRRGETFFVNSRHILSPLCQKALLEGFENVCMVGKFPFCVLNFNIDARFIDVNVHPNKIEVRFSDEKKMYESVYWAVKNALNKEKYIPELKLKEKSIFTKENIEISKKENSAEFNEINLLRNQNLEKRINDEKEIYNTNTKTQTFETFEKNIEKMTTENKFFSKDDIKNLSALDKEIKIQKTQSEEIKKDDTKKVFSLEDFVSKKETKENITFDFKEDISTKVDIKEEIKEETKEVKEETKDISFKIIGQAFGTYIICQIDDSIEIIDQHACQERIYYERLKNDFEAQNVSSQYLLIPKTIKEDAKVVNMCTENKDIFLSLGFDFKIDADLIKITKVPSFFQDDYLDAFYNLCDLIFKNTQNVKKAFFDEALYTLACKKAIKANHILNEAEMKSLVTEFFKLKNINTCPHARPVSISLTKKELEKNFKRIV